LGGRLIYGTPCVTFREGTPLRKKFCGSKRSLCESQCHGSTTVRTAVTIHKSSVKLSRGVTEHQRSRHLADDGQLGNQRPRDEKGGSRLDEPEIFRSYVLSLNVECQAAGVCVPLRFFGLSIFPTLGQPREPSWRLVGNSETGSRLLDFRIARNSLNETGLSF
jgi:hypothetical protein